APDAPSAAGAAPEAATPAASRPPRRRAARRPVGRGTGSTDRRRSPAVPRYRADSGLSHADRGSLRQPPTATNRGRCCQSHLLQGVDDWSTSTVTPSSYTTVPHTIGGMSTAERSGTPQSAAGNPGRLALLPIAPPDPLAATAYMVAAKKVDRQRLRQVMEDL